MVKELFCNNCNDYRAFYVISRKEVYVVKDTEVKIEAKVSMCKCCNSELFNEEMDEDNFNKAYSIYRKNQGILSPSEIKTMKILDTKQNKSTELDFSILKEEN